MTLFALGLVVVGALIHALWNLLAKHSNGGAHFVWCYSAVCSVLYLPLAVWAVSTGGMKWSWLAVGMIGATGLLHLGYSLILQGGYRRAGLSVVYPVARGTGPALSVIGAVFLLGEHMTVASATGAFLIVSGVLVIGLARSRDRASQVWTGIRWGGLTGLFIAAYTLNDGAAVRIVGLSPIVVDYFGGHHPAHAIGAGRLARSCSASCRMAEECEVDPGDRRDCADSLYPCALRDEAGADQSRGAGA